MTSSPDAATARSLLLLALACACAGLCADIFFALRPGTLSEAFDLNVDELWFLVQAGGLWADIASGDWASASRFGAPYGYGPLFWWTSALGYGAAEALGLSPSQSLPFLRLAMVALKWAGVLFLWRSAVPRGPLASSSLLLLLCACPLLWFHSKMFSAELPLFFLASLASGCLLRGRLASAAFFAALAVSVKTLAVFVPLALLPFVWAALRHALDRSDQAARIGFAGVLGAAPFLPVLLVPEALAEFIQWQKAGLLSDGGSRAMAALRHLLRPRPDGYLHIEHGLSAVSGLLFGAFLWRGRIAAALRCGLSDPLWPFAASLLVAFAGIVLLAFGAGFFEWYWMTPLACGAAMLAPFAAETDPSLRPRLPLLGAVLLAVSAWPVYDGVRQRFEFEAWRSPQARASFQSLEKRLEAFSATACGPARPLLDSTLVLPYSLPGSIRARDARTELAAKIFDLPVFLKYGRLPAGLLEPGPLRLPGSSAPRQASGIEQATHAALSASAPWQFSQIRIALSPSSPSAPPSDPIFILLAEKNFVLDWSDGTHLLFVREDLAGCLPPASPAKAP